MAYNVANNLRVAMPDPIGVDQLKRRNALGEQEMANDQQRNALYGQQIQQNESRMQADQQQQALEMVRAWAPGAYRRVLQNPAEAAGFVARAKQFGITGADFDESKATIDDVEQIAQHLGLEKPAAPVPFDQTPDALKIKMQGEQAMALERARQQGASSLESRRAASAAELERLRQAGAGAKGDGPKPQLVNVTLPDGATQQQWVAPGEGKGVPVGAPSSKQDPKKLSNAKDVLDIIAIAEPLLNKATGSYIGTGIDMVGRAFGGSTQGGLAISELKALQAALMLKMPRMEGPQSNLDVQLYREAAGQIGDPTVPTENKKAALGVVKRLNEQYAGQRPSAPAKPGAPAKAAPKRVKVDAEGNVIGN